MRYLTVPGLPTREVFPMPAPTVEPTEAQRLEHLHKRIEAALATVRGARACWEHCPSQDNLQAVERAERHLDTLLGDPLQPRQEATP